VDWPKETSSSLLTAADEEAEGEARIGSSRTILSCDPSKGVGLGSACKSLTQKWLADHVAMRTLWS